MSKVRRNFLSKVRGLFGRDSVVRDVVEPRAIAETNVAPNAHVDAPSPATTAAPAAALRVVELDEASIAADLFRRKFAQEIPNFPKHFVAMIGERCAGYVHYTPWRGDYLCGGLCIDDRVYRSLDSTLRADIRARGGIAEIMMRAAHEQLSDATAIWGYIGDKQAEAVDRRVGFVPVAEPYLFAIWKKSLSDSEKAARVAEALKLGPF